MESVLGGYDLREDLRELLRDAGGDIRVDYTAPNLGRQTRELMGSVEPGGWFTLTERGELLHLKDGRIVGAPVNDEGRAGIGAEVAKGQPLVVYGMGCAHSVHAIRATSVAPVLVYEPDPSVLRRFLDVHVTLPGVSVCCTLDDFAAMFQHFLQGRTSVSVLASPEYVAQTQDKHVEWGETIGRIINAEQVTVNTISLRMPEWIRHLARNARRVGGMVPAMHFAGKFAGVPALIVGAGPSLDRNAELLHEAKKHMLVIAVDVVSKALDKRGFEPHMVVTVEGKGVVAKHLAGVSWMAKVPKLFSLQASPESFEAAGGDASTVFPWCDSNYAFKQFAEEVLGVEGLPIGGSVTTAAHLFAEAMGCNPIVLVGQDLANTTAGGPPYADGADVSQLERLADGLQVEAWGGQGTVTSAVQWDHARVWFEQRARKLSHERPEVELVNATEGGSHIIGYTDEPLADVIERVRGVSVPAVVVAPTAARLVQSDVDAWFAAELTKFDTIAEVAAEASRAAAAAARMAYSASRAETRYRGASAWHKRTGRMLWAARSEVSKRAADECIANAREVFTAKDAAETAFRNAAGGSCLFTGWTQALIRSLNELHARIRPGMTMAEATRVLTTEAVVFAAMGDAAAEMAAMVREAEANGSQKS